MQAREPEIWYVRLGPPNIVVFFTGITLLLVGLSFDWAHLLTIVRFPTGELNNRWMRADLATLRCVCVVIATVLIISRIVVWRYPQLVTSLSNQTEVFISTAARMPLFTPLSLATLVSMKTVLQLGLYLIGYAAYAADDFSRSLSADYWLYYRKLDLGWDGWLGLSGSGWLPFSDYLFGLGLALHRDLYLTPKIINLAISGIAVIVVYLLGRELFGRTAGFLTASLFAFQPWHVWLGISGMTSDLPSIVLIALFGLFLVRWLRTDDPRALLALAGSLGIANGFRYENWVFSAVFSLLVVFIAVSRRRRGRLPRRWVSFVVCALTMINAFPVIWIITSYVVLGDWLPALHITNAWMVAFMASPNSTTAPAIPLAVNQSPDMAQINMLVLAFGAFPVELALSIAGVALFLRSDTRKPFRPYFVVLVATFLLFAVVFKGRLPASLVFARYFLPFMVLLLPYAGFFLVQLFRAPGPWRHEAAITTCLILLTTAALDVGRAFNYPAMFPKEAIDVGWTIRSLQETGTIPEGGKILIERAADWGDLGIVAIANRPERFVAMNELAYQRLAVQALPYRRVNWPALTASGDDEGVRGSSCDNGFHVDTCSNSLLREEFSLVILASPKQVRSFQKTFQARSWNIGKYHIFDMKSLPPSGHSTQSDFGAKRVEDQEKDTPGS
jgi:Dolichyl-phosphate-mannose-protein mannosyltransferase